MNPSSLLFVPLLVRWFISPAPCLSWPWDTCREMIARAVLPLLRLNSLIVHMHIELHRRHILMPKQILQAERIVAQNEVADRKRVTKNVWTDPFPRNSGSLFQASKQ